MNKPVDPRMELVLKSQLKAYLINALIALALSFGTILWFYGMGFYQFLCAAIMAYPIHRFLNFLSLLYVQMKIYGGDMNKMLADAEVAVEDIKNAEVKNTTTEVKFTVLNTPADALGVYMDKEFYDWLDLRDGEGNTNRWNFKGIAAQYAKIEPGELLIPPGLIYQVEQTPSLQ